MMEAESIFGLDFDPAEFDQYASDAEPPDFEGDDEDGEDDVSLSFSGVCGVVCLNSSLL